MKNVMFCETPVIRCDTDMKSINDIDNLNSKEAKEAEEYKNFIKSIVDESIDRGCVKKRVREPEKTTAIKFHSYR